jgi:hypothetical protein
VRMVVSQSRSGAVAAGVRRPGSGDGACRAGSDIG